MHRKLSPDVVGWIGQLAGFISMLLMAEGFLLFGFSAMIVANIVFGFYGYIMHHKNFIYASIAYIMVAMYGIWNLRF